MVRPNLFSQTHTWIFQIPNNVSFWRRKNWQRLWVPWFPVFAPPHQYLFIIKRQQHTRNQILPKQDYQNGCSTIFLFQLIEAKLKLNMILYYHEQIYIKDYKQIPMHIMLQWSIVTSPSFSPEPTHNEVR